MAKYLGWSLMKSIKIVYSVYDTIEVNNKKIPKAYIVDSSNKKSLQTAIDWASHNYGQYKGIEPTIIETVNSDFNFSHISSNKCINFENLSFSLLIINFSLFSFEV